MLQEVGFVLNLFIFTNIILFTSFKDVQGPPGGAIAGAVTGVVIFIVAGAVVVVLVLVVITRHLNKKKQVDRMQMDILAM